MVRRKIHIITIAAAILVTAILTIICVKFFNDKKALESALSDTEARVQLLQDVKSKLEAQNEEQKSLIESLQTELEDFLNIEDAEPVITGEQIEEQLSAASELVTQKYIYTRAARETSNKTWMWGWTMPLSDSSLLVMYDGEIKAGINFSGITVDVNQDERIITVVLPKSTVLNNNIPQEAIEVLEVKNSLFNEISFDDYNDFIASQKPVAEQKAIEMGLLDDADREAQAIVRAFLNLIPGIDTYKLDIVTK